MACAESLRVQAYFDGELDAIASAEIERHRVNCTDCGRLLEQLGDVRAALRRESRESVPADLVARIGRLLDQETQTRRAPRYSPGRSTWRERPFWVGAFSGMTGTAIAAVLTFWLVSPSAGARMPDELLASHLRSLLPSHLIDVESTDQHTVKPWFAGHADVSPAVADFAQQGYRLLGGRVDIVDRQRGAVSVYKYGAHIINVFTWSAAGQPPPETAVRSGYRMVFWRYGDLTYGAVSDCGWDELMGLERLLRKLAVMGASPPPCSTGAVQPC